ncbi:Uncharacterised protein [Serratia rubidaea]|uniref:Uncharacterized protein n=1 Tax=Serratia rubidaea TaxID=61652 RepID=A0A3S4FR90_SERRU|nr:Uncharacterised protein [Serratia rubidaea]
MPATSAAPRCSAHWPSNLPQSEPAAVSSTRRPAGLYKSSISSAASGLI